jgi:prevent-host-death family protein
MTGESVKKVGARELRHDLRAILDRVWEGESLEITDRGRPVARLVPLPGRETRLERLIADGAVTEARRPLHPLPRPIEVANPVTTISEALEEQRADSVP